MGCFVLLEISRRPVHTYNGHDLYGTILGIVEAKFLMCSLPAAMLRQIYVG